MQFRETFKNELTLNVLTISKYMTNYLQKIRFHHIKKEPSIFSS